MSGVKATMIWTCVTNGQQQHSLWEHQEYKEQTINDGWGERRRLEEGEYTKGKSGHGYKMCAYGKTEELMKFGHKVIHPGGNASG
jgi:hypothetical protein